MRRQLLRPVAAERVTGDGKSCHKLRPQSHLHSYDESLGRAALPGALSSCESPLFLAHRTPDNQSPSAGVFAFEHHENTCCRRPTDSRPGHRRQQRVHQCSCSTLDSKPSMPYSVRVVRCDGVHLQQALHQLDIAGAHGVEEALGLDAQRSWRPTRDEITWLGSARPAGPELHGAERDLRGTCTCLWNRACEHSCRPRPQPPPCLSSCLLGGR